VEPGEHVVDGVGNEFDLALEMESRKRACEGFECLLALDPGEPCAETMVDAATETEVGVR
jgi:hypothetical protein